MEKVYNITNLRFDSGFMILVIDNQTLKFKLSDFSEKLTNATDYERNDFRISPSGYGIHWRIIDEDISVNGLLKLSNPVKK